MMKFRLFVLKIKRNIFTLLILIFTLCLLYFSSNTIIAAKSALKLWANSILPSLFPFFIATELLSYTNLPYILGNTFKFIMKPLFNVSGEGFFALFMGWISRVSSW